MNGYFINIFTLNFMPVRLLTSCLTAVVLFASITQAQPSSNGAIQQSLNNSIRITPQQLQKALDVQKKIQNLIEEKVRYTKEDIEHALEQSALHSPHQIDRTEDSQPTTGVLGIGTEKVVSEDANSESEIHAAINPTDSSNMVVSPIRSTQNPLEGLICPIYYTKDFGKTWSKSSFQTKPKSANALTVGGGDPMFAYDAAGKLYMSWINLYIENFKFDTLYEEMSWAYSTDGGVKWNREAQGVIGKTILAGANQSEFYDKQWMVVDHTDSPYRGTLYAGIFHPSGTDVRIGLRRKEAGAKEFIQATTRPVGNNYSLNQFTSVDVDPQGGVHLTFFGDINNAMAPALYHAISLDGGKTLNQEVKIADVQIPRFTLGQEKDSIIGVQASRLYPCPHFVIDKSATSPYKGNCYMVWTANGVTTKAENGLDIYFSISTDNGTTWSTPSIVNDDVKGKKSEQFYPSITVNPNGVVCLAWYDRRNDSQNLQTEYYMTFSFDGGKSFIKNFAVSQKPTDFSTVGLLNGGFGVGEYNELLATGTYAIPFWADARSNDGNMNVYSAVVPITQTTGVAEQITTLDSKFVLMNATPNPSAGATQIGFSLESSSKVVLEVYDITGTNRTMLYNGTAQAGEHFVSLPAGMLPSGKYFYKITTDFGYSIKSLVLIN